MALHRLKCSRPLCWCEGVPFGSGAPHRPGTRGCLLHPMAGLDIAARHGATSAELEEIERRIREHLMNSVCPF